MSKAEERALEAYPFIDGEMSKTQNANAGRMYARNIFKKGYEQAEKDLTDQAREAVKITRVETLQEVKEKLLIMLNTSVDNKHFFEQLDDYIEELKEAIKDE